MKLPIRVSEESREPIYHQIESQIKALIMGGQLPSGTPLPSIRALANDLSCSVITTRRAYQNLESQKFIKTLQGKGTFVSEVDAQHKEEEIEKILYEALHKSIEQGIQMGIDINRMRVLFENILEDIHSEHKE
ncbi:GntR family transcriptional regulator [Bacillus horti]|uniref:GntR family transcriptional regulator n=1 Tax=Caldalkalibacillus horti TaxID=77523 RepID=A0ABT9VWK7_9BACI|nr:GntR family transcriptional regulator [Bacillus horti]MDQ0165376.1 GntR family transcriptional regulator [Bacillus horti]